MTLLGFARVLRVSLSVDHPTDDMSTILRKSREGLYFTTEATTSSKFFGVEYDGSNMTRETCGLAVVDDQV